MNLKYTIVLSILFFLQAGTLSIKAQQVIAEAENDTILIGDHQRIVYTVSKTNEGTITPPVLETGDIKGIELLEGPLIDTLIFGDTVSLRYQYKVTSFDSGDYQIPVLPLLYYHNNSTDTLLTAPISFRVNSLEVDTAKAIMPIKGPIEAPITFAEALPFILIGLGIILLVIILYMLIKRIQRKQPVIPRMQKPLEPPHIEAKKALNKLKGKDLTTPAQIKAYYTELSEITRYYIWRQLQVKTLEKTSEEIYNDLKEKEFKNIEAMRKLRDLFTIADYVKFAKYVPAAHEHERCLQEAYAFVELTEPQEDKNANKKEERTAEETHNQNKK
ncbi:MAG: hypothetical protein ACQESW_04080 [Bacteroidota bacterium]|jgi:hypothetical protein